MSYTDLIRRLRFEAQEWSDDEPLHELLTEAADSLEANLEGITMRLERELRREILRELAERYARDPHFRAEVDEALGVTTIAALPPPAEPPDAGAASDSDATEPPAEDPPAAAPPTPEP